MYRTLILLVACAAAVLSAPQQNSNITYVKQHPAEITQPTAKPTDRESRIEKLPLTIPGNVEETQTKENHNSESNKTPSNNTQPVYNYSDRIYSIKTKPKTQHKVNSTENNVPSIEDIKEPANVTESNDQDVVPTVTEFKDPEIVPTVPESNDSDIVPAESINNDRVALNTELDPEIESTQSDEFVTEKYEEEPTVTTEIEEYITKAPTPRLLPKLSYFGKSSTGSFSQNLIASPGKRRFRSRCRCEKIWNCAKLQISVPRCPEEYFMCCS
ncbi:uncharacterized protein LOC110370822 [Helicoverpa armigera]|uniref:uncharacterized protein LOC110370822 n=1 Tax=Helicoverpa armigera TaxID=29058 RepID=UPI003083C47E